MITIKTPEEIAIMRANARLLCAILAELVEQARPGVTTAALDALAERLIRQAGAVPTFKGYRVKGKRAFPASICTSVNEQIVHGIPSEAVVLREGDLLSVDVGLRKDGYCADTADTAAVGQPDEGARRLLTVAAEALRRGIAQARAGGRVGDISHAIEETIQAAGLGIVRHYVGHGIGRQMHEDPNVPNFGPAGKGPRLHPGMVLAIEPMVMEDLGSEREEADGWTVVTPAGGRAVHLEEMVLITEGEPELLTDGHSFRFLEERVPATSETQGVRT